MIEVSTNKIYSSYHYRCHYNNYKNNKNDKGNNKGIPLLTIITRDDNGRLNVIGFQECLFLDTKKKVSIFFTFIKKKEKERRKRRHLE